MDKKWKKIGIALVCVTVLGGAGITIATMNPQKEVETHVSKEKKQKNVINDSKGKTSKKVIEQAKGKGDEKKEEKGTIGNVTDQKKPKSSLSSITGGNWQRVDRSPVANTLAAIDKQIEQKKTDEKKKEATKVPTKKDPIVPNESKPIPIPKPDIKPKPEPKPEPTPTPEVNYQLLSRLFQSAQQIDRTHYTPNSYQILASEMSVAGQMIQEQTATQAQVDVQVARLQAAINQLIKKADTNVLAEWVATGNAIDRTQYTTASVAVFEHAMSHAQVILADENSSQSLVDTAALQLQQAIDQLVKRGDKTILYALVTQANAVDRELYTEGSLTVMDQALQQANAVLSNGDATEGEIQHACQQLQSGLDQLKKKEDPAYTLVLIKRLLTECDALKAEEYTENSFNALKTEMTKSKALVERPNVTTQEAKEQLQALQNAKKNLVKRANKKALVAILDEVSRLQSQDYTPESWEKLMTAKKGSQQLLEDSNATQQQIDAKVKEIRIAIDQLQPMV